MLSIDFQVRDIEVLTASLLRSPDKSMRIAGSRLLPLGDVPPLE